MQLASYGQGNAGYASSLLTLLSRSARLDHNILQRTFGFVYDTHEGARSIEHHAGSLVCIDAAERIVFCCERDYGTEDDVPWLVPDDKSPVKLQRSSQSDQKDWWLAQSGLGSITV